MLFSFQKLLKYLELETSRNFDNKAIIGGFEKVLPIWSKEAIKEGIDSQLVNQIHSLFNGYSNLHPAERKAVIHTVKSQILENTTQKINQSKSGSNISKSQSKNLDAIQQEAILAPLNVIRGIGEKQTKRLKNIGLENIHDLLHYYPRRYNDFSNIKTINQVEKDEVVTIVGAIQYIDKRKARSGKMTIVDVRLSDGYGSILITWFNQPWLTKQFNIGKQIVVSGQVDKYRGNFTMTNPEWEHIEKKHLHTNRIVPVYSLTSGIKQKWMREKIYEAVSFWSERVQEFIPQEILEDEDLIGYSQALENIHFPKNHHSLEKAKERLSFDEIFYLQLGALTQKREWQSSSAREFSIDQEIINSELSSLPFELTNSQEKVLKEIQTDLASGRQMNRMLQGDVGSGKTIIARFAMEIIIRNGAQAAMLAPTSILAQQHYENIRIMLLKDKVLSETEIALLIGDTAEKRKQEIREKLFNGEIKLVIGTHALLEDPVSFNHLQMIVIDEQHRFGVQQRANLRSKGENPHVLIMSATPIPRSLALTLYGDLEISSLLEMPIGRKPVKTRLIHPGQRDRAFEIIDDNLSNGSQIFIVYPQIEESDIEDGENSLSVLAGFNKIKNEVFSNYEIALLHGKMKQEEKDQIMNDFKDNKYQILVSTTVIEVGLDIPNATVILIEGANRFGLAQLHQLRGRVGRGEKNSFCLLIPEEVTELENDRLRMMTQTNDGFKLAEYDLKTRGPGEFFGKRQSGYLGLKLANISDIKLITKARNRAIEYFNQDPNLESQNSKLIKFEMRNLWNFTNGELS